MIALVVITHGRFGEGILSTAQDMVGKQERVLALSVTTESGPQKLADHIVDIQSQWGTAQTGVLYLVDMLGGTPCNQALLQTRGLPAEIVTGVNLYMVLSAFKNRSTMDLKSLAVRVSEDGRKSITLPCDLLARKPS